MTVWCSKRLFKAVLPILIALSLILSGCHDKIPDFPLISQDSTAPAMPPEEVSEADPSGMRYAGELYGSYLTMYTGHASSEERGLPFFRVFRSYAEIEEYYNSTESDHIYAKHFTTAMASFTDNFFSSHDVLILSMVEPSCYINHTAEPICITDDRIIFNITRHTPEEVPLLNTQYQLIFTAPIGSFDGVDGLEMELNISKVYDKENNSAYDADYFRLYTPDYTSFCYRSDPLTDSPDVVVDAIDGYEELVYFYDKYKTEYDLDANFREKIGTLYSWDICERYILIAVIVPCADEVEPKISELFVNNLQIYVTVEASEAADGEKAASSCLLLCGIERRDLTAVDLSAVYLSIEKPE